MGVSGTIYEGMQMAIKENIAYVESQKKREKVLQIYRTINTIYPGKILEPELMPDGSYYLRELPRRNDESLNEKLWGKMVEDTFVGAIISGEFRPVLKKV